MNEVEHNPITKPIKTPLGYWTVVQDGKSDFAWIVSTPVDPRNIDLSINSIREHDLPYYRAQALKSDLHIDFNNASNTVKFINDADAIHLAIALDRNRARALDLAFDISRAAKIDRAKKISYDIAPNRTINLDRDFAVATVIGIAIDLALNIARYRYDELARELALDLFLDIFTLQERIAGRSPAFEGIRLVFTRQSPSRIPLSRRHSSTFEVIFTNPRREGRLNQSSLR
jgi:hypothetical protein